MGCKLTPTISGNIWVTNAPLLNELKLFDVHINKIIKFESKKFRTTSCEVKTNSLSIFFVVMITKWLKNIKWFGDMLCNVFH